jgi:dihydroxy-acid dehydratase
MSAERAGDTAAGAVSAGLRQGLASYGDPEFSLFLRRVFIKAAGYGDDALDRPIVGIVNTASDFNPCHGNVPALTEAVRRGVLLAGGLPLAFPTISIHESFAHPTSMFLRNLMAMDTEEMIRAQPMDAVVLIGGCDKTLPAQMMAAASADRPAIMLPVGPMLTGHHRGEPLGACTDCRRLWADFRAGRRSAAEMDDVSGKLAPTVGTCMVMGTASTMACLAEALGFALPGSATIPAVHADRVRIAELTGRRAVAMITEGPLPSDVLTRPAFGNAIAALHAIGGSTNALIHLAAIMGRLGFELDLDAVDAAGREIPVIVDLKPSGTGYMEDLHRAGGMPRVLSEIAGHLDLTAMTVNGLPLAAALDPLADSPSDHVIRSIDEPLVAHGALAILRGNLAPRGAVIKISATDGEELLRHEGRAVVFESVADMVNRIDDDDLGADPSDVLVLRNAGPVGAPGMPEAGYIPIPRALARAGIRDMVRISDARMSGTAFGTIVLHITPEAAIGGPLAAVRTGDRIRLDVPARRIDLLIGDDEWERRLDSWAPAGDAPRRGYALLHRRSVLQADQGCDFDFLRGEFP